MPGISSMVLVGGVVSGIGCEVLVDTGAQSSVLSSTLVNQLGLSRLLDRSMQGVAQGVGHARIIGRCLDVPIELGHAEFLVDFVVIEANTALAILGLDQLRRFKCIVDLERDVLVFGGAGGVEVGFLPPESSSAWRHGQSYASARGELDCAVM